MATAGYSGTPLAKKLGIKSGCRLRLVDAPAHYFELFTDLPADISILKDKRGAKDVVHYFTTKAEQLHRDIAALRDEIAPDGMVWVSWPKKAAKVPTDVDENVVRDLALKNGLVDVKVCAIDDTWSGLKLVIRLKDRKR
ncbi:MAG TPA: DUF3052 family protein [Flavobacteriales bacterium]|jgi:hypothetical protein|nr:DUF3052 family protein [Flavobacteriales bacterium]